MKFLDCHHKFAMVTTKKPTPATASSTSSLVAAPESTTKPRAKLNKARKVPAVRTTQQKTALPKKKKTATKVMKASKTTTHSVGVSKKAAPAKSNSNSAPKAPSTKVKKATAAKSNSKSPPKAPSTKSVTAPIIPMKKKAKKMKKKDASLTKSAIVNNTGNALATPKPTKTKKARAGTPATSTSTSSNGSTTSLRKSIAKRLNMDDADTPTKKSRSTPSKDTTAKLSSVNHSESIRAAKKSSASTKQSKNAPKNEESIPRTKNKAATKVVVTPEKQREPKQAHQIDWTTKAGVTEALLSILSSKSSRAAVANMSFEELLEDLVSQFPPKDLMSAFPLMGMSLGLNIQAMDLKTPFSTGPKGREFFMDTILKNSPYSTNP